MKAAPCSWRVVMWRTSARLPSASRMSIVSSPGTENTYSQPSAARHSTRSWAAVRCVTPGRVAGDVGSSADPRCAIAPPTAAGARRRPSGLDERDIDDVLGEEPDLHLI